MRAPLKQTDPSLDLDSWFAERLDPEDGDPPLTFWEYEFGGPIPDYDPRVVVCLDANYNEPNNCCMGAAIYLPLEDDCERYWCPKCDACWPKQLLDSITYFERGDGNIPIPEVKPDAPVWATTLDEIYKWKRTREAPEWFFVQPRPSWVQ